MVLRRSGDTLQKPIKGTVKHTELTVVPSDGMGYCNYTNQFSSFNIQYY